LRAFLSYSHADEAAVDSLLPELSESLSIWIDKVSLLPGVSLLRQIATSIHGSSCLLVVLSNTSIHSEWVRKEIAIADAQGVKIIGLRIDNCVVPPEISYLPYVDLATLGKSAALPRLKQMLDLDVVIDGRVRLGHFIAWGNLSVDIGDHFTVILSTPDGEVGSGGLVLDRTIPLVHVNTLALEVNNSSPSNFDGYSRLFRKMLKLQLDDQPVLAVSPSQRVRDAPEWLKPGDGEYLFSIPFHLVQRGAVDKIEIILGRGKIVNIRLSMQASWWVA
jgi:TIR domain-containing protein